MLTQGIKNVSPQRVNKSMDMSQQDQESPAKSNKDIGDHLVGESKIEELPAEDQNQVVSNDDMKEGGDKSAENVSNPNTSQVQEKPE